MTTALTVNQKAKTLKQLLEVSKKEIAAALPKHITSDRLARIALTEARKNPELLECNQASFIGAIIQCAQLGLEPGSSLGHSYLVPFNNRKAKTKDVQFIVGYRGMIELAQRSSKVSHIVARTVYAEDEFSYEFGSNESLTHKPSQTRQSEKISHFYAIVFLKEGGKIFDVISEGEMQRFKKSLNPSDYSPWNTDYESMGKKTVIRRLFKYTPVSIEIQSAVGLDEAAERGEQHNADIIEAEVTTVEAPSEKGNALIEAIQSAKAAQVEVQQ